MPTKSLLFTREPAWLPNRHGLRHRLPEEVASWIYEPGSLTRRLRSYYGNAVTVRILYHRWLTPFLSERELLDQPEHRFCLTREVLLHADGEPLILARTIIPEKTIQAAHRNLSHLGTRPLGEVIFSYPNLERLELEIAKTTASVWTEHARAIGGVSEAPIWGRRTVYAIMQQPMLVNEFFLQGALAIA